MSTPRRARGVTLIQLMIGTALAASLSAAIASFLIQSTRSSRADILQASMLDELGYATAQLTLELEMAGFWAAVHDPDAVALDGTLAIGTDCGAANWYRDLKPLQVLDNASRSNALASFPCLPGDDLVEGTDIVAIKRVLGRVAGTDTDASAMQDGTIYLRTHDKAGLLYRHGAGTPGVVDTPFENWEYSAAVYYVQNYLEAGATTALPSLCRMVLRSASGGVPSFVRECLSRGIENLQIEVGVDDDGDASANYFTSAPSAGDLERAVTARVYLQARSAQADPDYKNEKSYLIGNMTEPFVPAGDQVHYYRKTLSSEVALRNPRALLGVAVQ